jgi:hypothetical protein
VISNLLDDGTPIREASINVIVSDKVMENPVFIAEKINQAMEFIQLLLSTRNPRLQNYIKLEKTVTIKAI